MIDVEDVRAIMPSVQAAKQRNNEMLEAIEAAIIEAAKEDKDYIILKGRYLSTMVSATLREKGFKVEPLYETEEWNGSTLRMNYKISW